MTRPTAADFAAGPAVAFDDQDGGIRGGGASAGAVNDAGDVVGAAGHATAFVWRPGAAADTFDYLFRDPPAAYSAAAGVSDNGVVVGGVILRRSPGIQFRTPAAPRAGTDRPGGRSRARRRVHGREP